MTVAASLLLLLLFSSLLVVNEGSAIALFLTTIDGDFFPPNTLLSPPDIIRHERNTVYVRFLREKREKRILMFGKIVG